MSNYCSGRPPDPTPDPTTRGKGECGHDDTHRRDRRGTRGDGRATARGTGDSVPTDLTMGTRESGRRKSGERSGGNALESMGTKNNNQEESQNPNRRQHKHPHLYHLYYTWVHLDIFW